MRAKSKYEILIGIFLSVVVGLLTYFTYIDYKTPISRYPSTTGIVDKVGICRTSTTVQTGKSPVSINSKVFCFDIGNNKKYQVFKTDRNYERLLAEVKRGDNIEVWYSAQYDEERFEIIQIVKNDKKIYSLNDWKKQERIELGMLLATSIFFFLFGLIRHINYLKSNR